MEKFIQYKFQLVLDKIYCNGILISSLIIKTNNIQNCRVSTISNFS